MNITIAYLVLLIVLCGITCAESIDLEELLTRVETIELTVTEAEFKTNHPTLRGEKTNLPGESDTRIVYHHIVSGSLVPNEYYSFENGKLTEIRFSGVQNFYCPPDLKVAAEFVKWCKPTILLMFKKWGNPTWTGIMNIGGDGVEFAMLEWKRASRYISVDFSTPRCVLSNAETNRDPPTILEIGISSIAQSDFKQKFTNESEFDKHMLDGDYETFLKKISVTIDTDSKRFMPDSLKDVYLGITREELVAIRPQIHFGDRFDQTFDGVEKIPAEFFHWIGYNFRNDRLIMLELSTNDNGQKTSLENPVAWCESSWGIPQSLITAHKKQDTIPSGRTVRIFIWERAGSTAGLYVYQAKRTSWRIVIFEKKMSLDVAFPHGANEEYQTVTGSQVQTEWSSLRTTEPPK